MNHHTSKQKKGGRFAPSQYDMCCGFYYYYKFHQPSLLIRMCDSQLGKVTVSLLRRLLPTRLTQVLTQGPGPPFWVQASHGRLPEAQQRYRGTEVRMLTLRVPTEWPTLQLSGSSAHIPGIRRRGKQSGREREQRYCSSPPRPSGPLCCYPCPNLTFIGKSIHPGGPLSNLPENTMGEGQL